jgi:hypothetical protein
MRQRDYGWWKDTKEGRRVLVMHVLGGHRLSNMWRLRSRSVGMSGTTTELHVKWSTVMD